MFITDPRTLPFQIWKGALFGENVLFKKRLFYNAPVAAPDF